MPDGRRHTEIELTQVAYDVEGIRENYADVGLGVDTRRRSNTTASGCIRKSICPPGMYISGSAYTTSSAAKSERSKCR
ncbi:MAG TPA: hypothetical protein VHZ25_15825 [Acidobacteriaceae bacterium]|nr:hypothetical protein [Acidobacteriaceae bacterium]